MRERILLYGASSEELCAMCSCAGARADELVCVGLRFFAVRTHKGFVQWACADELVCKSECLLCGANPRIIFTMYSCAVRAHKGFEQCACAGELVPVQNYRAEPVRTEYLYEKTYLRGIRRTLCFDPNTQI